MSTTDTSLAAYHSIKHLLGEKQRKVCWALERFGPMDNEAIARMLEWPVHTVTPRILELRNTKDEKGNPAPIVIHAGYTLTRSGRKAHLWKLKEPPASNTGTPTNSLFS